jgi:hypothetical protein
MRTFGQVLVMAAVVVAASGAAWAQDAKLDTARIERLTGAKGKLDEKEGVFKVSVPRSDLSATVAGVKMTPAMGLTSWAAFQPMADHFMVMGDVVLTEGQVSPAMDAALQNGLEVTALHNHFLGDSPRVMFMHIGGMGDQEKLAAAVGKVFAAIKTTTGQDQMPRAEVAAESAVDGKEIETILGHKSEANGGVYKVTIGRTTTMHGQEVGNTMGVNTWAAFAGGPDQAVVDGDFAMTEDELQGVLKALRGHGINVVAIHNHMTHEEPRIVFLHFWGVGPAGELARSIRAALDTRSQKR